VLDADISGFFDNINHEWLLNHVHMDKVTLRKWLKSGVVDAGQLQRTDEGTPQGGIISPTLANITLNGLETGLMQFLQEKLKPQGAKAGKVNLVRYADDFVVTGSSKELLETVVRPWIPDGHFKLPHLWPVKLPHGGRSNYDDSAAMAMRAAASLSR
jgi:RNA-directed DNA polymerase